MHERYENPKIKEIWADQNKLYLWQRVEMAAIKAKEKLEEIEVRIYSSVSEILTAHPIDLDWWKAEDKVIHHDLTAFIHERQRWLGNYDIYFHAGTTSYDTEEPAFSLMMRESVELIKDRIRGLRQIIREKALKYRYLIMNARTHSQEAEIQSLGKRFLGYDQDLQLDELNLEKAAGNLIYSKFSGAIGNYGSVSPEVEKETLAILGFIPFYGATQIMPREIYAPVAQALTQICLTMDKIATAIRLGARSGRPIFQEPFGKKQTGSFAMPHKKNTINTEQVEGLARLAQGYLSMIMQNIKTWEERAIEQSCVERVAWPDLFHVTLRSLKVMNDVLSGLVVYPDNMLLEIIDSRGCYAAGEAKEFLKKIFSENPQWKISANDCYRIVQLAAFNVFEPTEKWKEIREFIPHSLTQTDDLLNRASNLPRNPVVSIQEIISQGGLKTSLQLAATIEEIQKWNEALCGIFNKDENTVSWNQIFSPSYLLRNEKKLYQEILGI